MGKLVNMMYVAMIEDMEDNTNVRVNPLGETLNYNFFVCVWFPPLISASLQCERFL